MDELTSKKRSSVEIFASLLGVSNGVWQWLIAGVLAVVWAAPVLLFFCGLFQVDIEFQQEAAGVAKESGYHKIAVESYLDCKDSLFQSKQQCLVTSVQLAQQAGLKDATELTKDIRELAMGSDLSISDVAEAGYRFVNPF